MNRRGFTIIELLVASLLLGILVTILTMVFNQSSIAWRTGIAGIADLDDIRDNMAEIREEADNAFLWGNKVQSLTGLWENDGSLRSRAYEEGAARILSGRVSSNSQPWDNSNYISVGNVTPKSGRNYIVNVMSAGPDRLFDTYDDIWSYPDDFE